MEVKKYAVICPIFGGYRTKKFDTFKEAKEFAKGAINTRTGTAHIYKLVE